MRNIVIKKTIQSQFEAFLQQGRIFFFSAPCGFGKSALAGALLYGREALCLNAADTNFALPLSGGSGWSVLMVDNLQCIEEEETQQALCELIRADSARRFVFLSRGAPPGYLMAYQYTGLMTVLHAEDLLFGREEIRALFRACEVPVTDSEITGILKESIGYPLGVAVTVQNMAGGRRFGPEIVTESFREVFRYFDAAIYHRFDLPLRRFLLELAPFENFDLNMARMVSGDPHAGELLDWLQRNTTMLRYDGVQRFRFWPQFRTFLLWEMEREYTEDKRCALFNRGGLYYELMEDYAHALECYTRGGDRSKVSELLIRNAELHPGMGYCSEMEKYYRQLPESEILASPSLMQGMSMLCALSMDYKGSEHWYHELEEFARRCGKEDAAGHQARSRLAWLDISLPQRGAESMLQTFPAVFRLLLRREVTLPPFSVTSNLPSLMNGGKDFSAWSKRDDFLYQTLRIPVETVLGRDGVGLADCALAESKFEKGEDITVRMLSMIPRMSEIRQRGTPDIEFAINALLARSQLASGAPEEARHTIEALRARYCDDGLTRFLPNMDAMLCRLALHLGDLDAADDWYREKAPRDPMHLNVMRRYQYLTQAMAELADGRPDAVLMTLSPLERYCRSCARHIDGIHLHILSAIALYRKKNEAWHTHLEQALATAAEYQFIRPVSLYGAAVLPLLREGACEKHAKWYARLLADVRAQAAFYPSFLQPRFTPDATLTATELQILHLICADRSNAEIGQIMDIKLPTVKTHVSHILEKLNVKRRSEAKTAAKKLRLISDHIQ